MRPLTDNPLHSYMNAQLARDPRFDSLSGTFNQELFEKSYSFLDDYRKSEAEAIRAELRKEKDEERKRKLQSLLTKMVCARGSV